MAPFITSFEKMLSAPPPAGLGIPVVNLIVEGGLGSLYEVTRLNTEYYVVERLSLRLSYFGLGINMPALKLSLTQQTKD